jgi:hypothetical protein
MNDFTAVDDDEPSPHDLAAIEAEWPLIAAEIDLVDAEIRVLSALHGPTALDWRRLRRAEWRVATEVIAHAARIHRPLREVA